MNLIIRVSEICCVRLLSFTSAFSSLERHCFLFSSLLPSVSPCTGKQHMVAPSQPSSTVHMCECQVYTYTGTQNTLLWKLQCSASFAIPTNFGLQNQGDFNYEFQRTIQVTLPLWVEAHMALLFLLSVALGCW